MYLISEQRDPSMVLNYNRSGFEYIVQDFAKCAQQERRISPFSESRSVSRSNTEEEGRFGHARGKTVL
jgi:hypothetical protein